MKAAAKKSTKEPAAPKAPYTVGQALGGIGGIIMAFVIASIGYSTFIVYMGTSGLTPKLMLIPQAVFAGLVVLYKFGKN